MARSKKGTLVPSCDERTRRIFYLHWQFLRRSEHYKDAAEECLRNLQALYDQLITQQQTLAPPPALSTPASALATKIDGLLRHSRPRTFLAIHPPRLEEKRPLLFDWVLDNDAGELLQDLSAEERHTVAKELIVYWEWEDANWLLNRHIAAFEDLAHTLEIATDVFCSGDPSLESLPTQPLTDGQFILGKFTVLCSKLCQKPDFLQQFPPLATLRQRWDILLPLDPGIPALPVRASYAVFPDIRPHHFKVLLAKTEPRITITLSTGPGASKESIQAEFNDLLSLATSRLNHRRPHYGERVEALSYYSEVLRAYDLNRDGKSDAVIARRMFPTVFTDDKKPFDSSNQEYRKTMQHVKDLLKAAKNLINNP
jgi:hypothetical protein